NPGLLAFGMTLEDLRAGVSRIRNPVIARVFRELGLMEKWGSGYKRIAEDCVAGGYLLPEWVELGPALRIVFRPHPDIEAADQGHGDVTPNVTLDVTLNVTPDVTLNERQTWFLAALHAGEGPRVKDLVERFGVTLRTARRDVAGLKDQGLVEFLGGSRKGSYRPLVSPGS
ncbi:MAG TPA: ATP-binding protein, partial [Thermoanaerobaculia bacterium]|nr:ATP-binding protein [Thermoanaerobaculia bacterium]